MTTWTALIAGFILITEDIFEGLRPHQIHSLQDPWGLVGLILVLLGILMRSWSASIIHKNDILSTTGPYALMRHPLYFGSLLIAMGFCTAIGDVENFVVVIGVLVPLHVRKALREERKLKAKFGDAWTEYTRRAGPLYPKSIPVKLLFPWSLSQWLRNQEYGAFVSGLIALAALDLWYDYPMVGSTIKAALWR